MTKQPARQWREQGRSEHEGAPDEMLAAIWAGLGRREKTLPTQLLYDERGSALFDAICELPEYYLTRTELAIMAESVDDMANAIGPDAAIIEYGSGSAIKIRMLLRALQSPAAYIPVDISREHLLNASADLAAEFPDLRVMPVGADFTRPFEVPLSLPHQGRRVAYFPGSTIGNFERAQAVGLLRQMARLVGADGRVLIGADLQKPRAVLEPAYDDASGVTANFSLNILHRINRDFAADFDPSRFRHRSYYDEVEGRIVITLVSTVAQIVTVSGRPFALAADEAIRTEYSHKYTLPGFAAMAAEVGLQVDRVWTDAKDWFSVQLLRPE
jgi:dimethylhistidine N-methyltransferase